MRLLSRSPLLLVAACCLLAPAVPARATDPEVAMVDCTGDLPVGFLHAPSVSGSGATITCVRAHAGTDVVGLSTGQPWISGVPMSATWTNQAIGDGVSVGWGYFTFYVSGHRWSLSLPAPHLTADGTMAVGDADPTAADDELLVTDGSELPFHLRYGLFQDRPCDVVPTVNTGCDNGATHGFFFRAEYVYDLPV
jgi:hypothetical protein